MGNYSEMEIQVAKNLKDKGYKWIAKDKNDSLYAFKYKPYKDETVWYADREPEINVCSFAVPIFKNIHWSDKEPTSIYYIINPQILDDIEKQYLERVLRPLPEVTSIVKVFDMPSQKERLSIRFAGGCYMYFPFFEKETMYKGMIEGKFYTPEELVLNLGGKHETD